MSDHYCCKRCGQRYDKCACVTTLKVEKTKYNLTDWFPSFTQPVRNGWYLTRSMYRVYGGVTMYGGTEMKFFCNGWWFWDDSSKSSALSPHEWRGRLK